MQFVLGIIAALLLFVVDAKAVAEQTERPGARWGHMFVYFPPLDSIVMFGGASERRVYRNDMWAWSNNEWRRLNIETPSARGFSAAAYDPKRKTIILHGGRGNENVVYSDLWEWDGMKWRLLDKESPFQSDHHAMAYVPKEKGVFLFGGWTGDGVSGESWVWDGDWRKVDSETTAVPPRSAFGMVYNDERARVELFGGLWINGQYADSWAWQDNEWQALTGPYENSSLDHHSMFYDPALAQTVIFGGMDYRYRMRKETREFKSSGLVETISADGPPARHSVSIAVDTRRNRAVLFGGKAYVGEDQVPLDDMWVWELDAWRELEDHP